MKQTILLSFILVISASLGFGTNSDSQGCGAQGDSRTVTFTWHVNAQGTPLGVGVEGGIEQSESATAFCQNNFDKPKAGNALYFESSSIYCADVVIPAPPGSLLGDAHRDCGRLAALPVNPSE